MRKCFGAFQRNRRQWYNMLTKSKICLFYIILMSPRFHLHLFPWPPRCLPTSSFAVARTQYKSVKAEVFSLSVLLFSTDKIRANQITVLKSPLWLIIERGISSGAKRLDPELSYEEFLAKFQCVFDKGSNPPSLKERLWRSALRIPLAASTNANSSLHVAFWSRIFFV